MTEQRLNDLRAHAAVWDGLPLGLAIEALDEIERLRGRPRDECGKCGAKLAGGDCPEGCPAAGRGT